MYQLISRSNIGECVTAVRFQWNSQDAELDALVAVSLNFNLVVLLPSGGEQSVVGLKYVLVLFSSFLFYFFKQFLYFGATQSYQSEQQPAEVLRRLAAPCHMGTTHQRSQFTHLAVRSATL